MQDKEIKQEDIDMPTAGRDLPDYDFSGIFVGILFGVLILFMIFGVAH